MTLHQRLINWWLAQQRERRRIAANRRDFLRTIATATVAAPFIDVGRMFETAGEHWRIRLLKQMASRNAAEALAAQEAFAAFISAPILQVVEQAPVISDLFKTPPFEPIPVIPLEIAWDDGTPPNPATPSLVETHNTWCHGWPRRGNS